MGAIIQSYFDISDEKALILKDEAKLIITPGTTTLDFGDKTPSQFIFDKYEAYRMRMLSFINGAIFAITYSPITQALKAERIRRIRDFAENKESLLSLFKQKTQGGSAYFDTELYQLYKHELPQISGLSSEQIALGEAFYVWQEYARPNRVTRFIRQLDEKNYLQIEQIDTIHHATLTTAQKKELIKIHQPHNLPEWFKKLDRWAKSYLRNIVPKKINRNWDKYEKCHPAILRNIPGQANATTHEFKITHVSQTGKKVLSHTIADRQGVPTSFDMSDPSDRQKSANENLTQILNNRLNRAKRSFYSAWGIEEKSLNLHFPVLLGGLLTPANQAGITGNFLDRLYLSGNENNTTLSLEKNKALDNFLLKENPKRIRFFNLNVALNSQRGNPLQADPSFLRYLENFILEMNSIVMAEDHEKSIRFERETRLKQLCFLLDILKNYPPAFIPNNRNSNLYLAAYYDVAMRLMSGLSIGNCKSSKDRKGVELIMADAMLIYCTEEIAVGNPPQFPRPNDIGVQRKRFVDIFCELYASGHQLLVAHDNSPGSTGIKDEGILDKDIIAQLNRMQTIPPIEKHPELKHNPKPNKALGIYKQSKELANFNKPGSFWNKHHEKIKKWGKMGAAVLLVTLSGILMASGALSPIGILGLALTAEIAGGTLALGGIVTATSFAIGGAVLTAIGCKIKDGLESKHNKKTTFAAQIKLKMPAIEKSEKMTRKNSTNSTTSRLPFTINRNDCDLQKPLLTSKSDVSVRSNPKHTVNCDSLHLQTRTKSLHGR